MKKSLRIGIGICVAVVLVALAAKGARTHASAYLASGSGVKRAAAYVEAFNSGDPANIQRYFLENGVSVSDEDRTSRNHARHFEELFASFGRLEVIQIDDQGEGEVEIMARTEKGPCVTISMACETSGKRKVIAIGFSMSDVRFGTRPELPEPFTMRSSNKNG